MNNNNFAKKLLTTLSVMSIVISLADVAHGTKHKKNKRNKSSANVTHSPKPVVTSALVPSIPTPSSRSSSVASHESSASTTGSEVTGGAHGTPAIEPVVTSTVVPSIPTPGSRSSSVASHESAAPTGSAVSDGMPDTSSHTSIPRPSPPSSSATAFADTSDAEAAGFAAADGMSYTSSPPSKHIKRITSSHTTDDIDETSDVSHTKEAIGTEVDDIYDPSSTPPKKKTTATSTSSTSSPPSKHIKRITSSHTTASKEGLSDDDTDETSDVSHTKEAIGTEVDDIYDPSSTPPKKKTTATSTSSTSSTTYGSRSSSAASRTSATSSATGISDTSSYASTGESSRGETTSSSRNIANSIYSTLVSNNNADANQTEQDESYNLINELAVAYRSDNSISDSTREKTKEVVNNLDQSEIDDLQNTASNQVDTDQRSNERNAALYAMMEVYNLDDSTEIRKKSANNKQYNIDSTVSDTLSAVTDAINARKRGATIFAPDNLELTDSDVGISAGDDNADYKVTRGLWIKGIYGTAKQSRIKNHDGYKSTSYGSVIGFDLDFNDQFVVGAGYSPVKSQIKLRKSSDKTLATSHIFSIYGNYWFNSAISVDAIIQAGLSHVDTKRVDNKKIAKGKLKNNTYRAESALNYQVKKGNVFVTPKVGLKYVSFHDGSFKEKGAGIYNIEAKGRNTKELSGILGINVMMPYKISDDLTIKPSIDGSMIYKLNERKDVVKAKLSWMDEYFKAEVGDNRKKSLYKTLYSVGTDFAIQYKNTELSAAYHLVTHKKYQGHQSSLTLKVLF